MKSHPIEVIQSNKRAVMSQHYIRRDFRDCKMFNKKIHLCILLENIQQAVCAYGQSVLSHCSKKEKKQRLMGYLSALSRIWLSCS